MRRLITTLAAGALLATGSLGLAAAPAAAQDWDHHHRYYGHHDHWRGHHNGWNGNGVGIGIAGLAAGALIGGAIANSYDPYPRYYGGPVYYERGPVYYERATPLYRVGGSHARACAIRYRTYDPVSDTFIGRGGRHYICRL
ncbi:BA14K family protein [Mangrovibrevibacter kandeliae]|uniref:BA14K family protein n=1 Tax=Mangrovibrevibacter kandeliae TaxID=2968473 RepID=UPI0021172D68|nr:MULTISPECIES: BA14K family protein [unclassified Aurantimonas]MCQ8782021.1 BA14K family protein [Aurantimonas sp. CSK15Z-1]MCW4115319.1 BA14K family protein [Aurantimonas sp. MSK8Z-1]